MVAYNHVAADSLRNELGLSRAMAAVMAARGFSDVSSAAAFLRRDAVVEQIEIGQLEAAQALAKCMSDGATIAVHGDYDCDGVC